MSRSFRLTADGDVAFPLVMVDDVTARLATRLRMLLGEWFLDLSDGTPYFQTILVANANLERIRSALTARILGTEGVASIETLDLNADRVRRELTVSLKARGPAGNAIVVELG